MTEKTTHIPFTQYLLPNGERRPTSIERPREIYDKAMEIIEAGYQFEAEVLTTGIVSLTIFDGEIDVEIELVENGPGVPVAIDRMVTNFHKRLKENCGQLE